MTEKYEIQTSGSGPVLVVLVGGEDAGAIAAGLKDIRVCTVSGFDWDEYLSPWPAPKVFKKGNDFGGRAEAFYTDLMDSILPEITREEEPRRMILAGYSLAGLFAMYACTMTDRFDGCASISGSMWFPDWLAYLAVHPLHCRHVYLSLGDQEKNTRNPIMSTVEACTEDARKLISAYADVTLEMNPGNHFNEPDRRIIKGIRHLAGQMEQ